MPILPRKNKTEQPSSGRNGDEAVAAERGFRTAELSFERIDDRISLEQRFATILPRKNKTEQPSSGRNGDEAVAAERGFRTVELSFERIDDRISLEQRFEAETARGVGMMARTDDVGEKPRFN